MAIERSRVSYTHVILGPEWIEAGRQGEQDRYWDWIRDRWHRDLQKKGWRLCEEPKETTEYNEERGEVWLHIRAVAEREVGNVFIAPLGTQPGESGWKLLGHMDGPIELKGPPAGRDRFA